MAPHHYWQIDLPLPELISPDVIVGALGPTVTVKVGGQPSYRCASINAERAAHQVIVAACGVHEERDQRQVASGRVGRRNLNPSLDHALSLVPVGSAGRISAVASTPYVQNTHLFACAVKWWYNLDTRERKHVSRRASRSRHRLGLGLVSTTRPACLRTRPTLCLSAPSHCFKSQMLTRQ